MAINNTSGATLLIVTDDPSAPRFIDLVPRDSRGKIETGLFEDDCAPSAYVVTTTDHRFVARIGPPVCAGQRHEITADQVTAARTRPPGPAPIVPSTAPVDPRTP